MVMVKVAMVFLLNVIWRSIASRVVSIIGKALLACAYDLLLDLRGYSVGD